MRNRNIAFTLVVIALFVGFLVWRTYKRVEEPRIPAPERLESPAAADSAAAAVADTASGWTPADTTQEGP